MTTICSGSGARAGEGESERRTERSRRVISIVSLVRRRGEYCRDECEWWWLLRWARGRERYETTDELPPAPTDPSSIPTVGFPRFTHQ